MRVAVLLTCFEEGATIGAALESVLAQTAAAAIAEILLVDDGSGPATARALDELEGRDPRLRILRGPGGWGVSAARNRAVAESQAPLLAFLDGDDAWMADKLERQLAVLDAHGEIDLVYTGYRPVGPDGRPGRAHSVYDLSASRRPARRYFLHDPPILPSCVLMRREALEAVGGFDPALAVFEDTDAFLRLAARAGRGEGGALKGLAAPLLLKRYRAGSLSAPRPGLMAHHAFAAFAAAGREPALAPLVGRRLAERAARLGLVAYYAGDLAEARAQAATARGLSLSNPRAFLLRALLAGGRPLRGMLAAALAGRARLHGR